MTSNNDITLIPQIKSMMDINKSQKDHIREAVDAHPEWDPLLRHDLLHHTLNQEHMPTRFPVDNDATYNKRLIDLRRRLDNENRLASCVLALMNHNEALIKNGFSSNLPKPKGFWTKLKLASSIFLQIMK